MNFKYIAVTTVFCVALCDVAGAASKLRPQRLRTEHMENPGVIDTRSPRLSWVNTPASESVKNASQSACRLVVATSEEKLEKGDYDAWDSGRIPTSQSYLVEYDGSTLKDGEDYFWRVMVWDNDGKASDWSETASWGWDLPMPAVGKPVGSAHPGRGKHTKKPLTRRKGAVIIRHHCCERNSRSAAIW